MFFEAKHANNGKVSFGVFLQTILVTLIVLNFVSRATSQPANARKNKRPVTAGLKVGVNTAYLVSKGASSDFGFKAGLVAGIFVNVPLNSVFTFQPELLYNQKGTTIRTSTRTTAKIHLDYLEVPVLLKAYLKPPGRSPKAAYLLVGPSFGHDRRSQSCHAQREALSGGSN